MSRPAPAPQVESACIVLTTMPDEGQAAALATGIVSERLGACVQILPVRSIYTWQGRTCDHAEALLLVKTRLDRYDALEAFLRGNHPYETPEILALPVVRGLAEYVAWVDDGTKP